MNAEIYDAFAPLVTAFAAAQSPALPVAYPGVPFDPPGEGQWLELMTFWNDGADYGMGVNGPSVVRGFFRVLMCERPGGGILAATATAEALIVAIPKGTVLGPALVESVPTLSGPITDVARVFHSVTFRWMAAR